MKKKKLWGGRFEKSTHCLVEEFTESISFDNILYKYDIMGSIAHCRMLAKQKIIAVKDSKVIIRALKEIEKEIESGKLVLDPKFEDIHTLIESRLIKKIGPVGGKLHTARSRNDQVALDVNLYLKDGIKEVVSLIGEVRLELVNLAEKNLDAMIPGFTHLQHAQPVLFAHHLMAYNEMFKRDFERMRCCYGRVNRMPLGAGALAGTPYPVDRGYVAELLGYPCVTENSMDTVADRDGLIEFCSAASILMMHLSRFCEELILWSSPEFQFVEISDAFCTGSSIMPQKKNPDIPELVRGKTGRVYGNLMSLLTLMKSLPMSYNRDLQEDKQPLFDTVDTVRKCLKVFSAMLPEIKVNGAAMLNAAKNGFLTATDLADYLVKKGMPFRNAHEVVGSIVTYCIRKEKTLDLLTIAEFKSFSPEIEKDVFSCLSLSASINSRKSEGATGLTPVKKAIAKAKNDLKKKKK
jgi:argininosuccinate lyase